MRGTMLDVLEDVVQEFTVAFPRQRTVHPTWNDFRPTTASTVVKPVAASQKVPTAIILPGFGYARFGHAGRGGSATPTRSTGVAKHGMLVSSAQHAWLRRAFAPPAPVSLSDSVDRCAS